MGFPKNGLEAFLQTERGKEPWEKTSSPIREWYNVELPREEAYLFRDCLINNSVPFESSEIGDMIHFECSLTDEEVQRANEWLENYS